MKFRNLDITPTTPAEMWGVEGIDRAIARVTQRIELEQLAEKWAANHEDRRPTSQFT